MAWAYNVRKWKGIQQDETLNFQSRWLKTHGFFLINLHDAFYLSKRYWYQSYCQQITFSLSWSENFGELYSDRFLQTIFQFILHLKYQYQGVNPSQPFYVNVIQFINKSMDNTCMGLLRNMKFNTKSKLQQKQKLHTLNYMQ